MPDKMPFGLTSDYPVGLFSFLDVVFPDDFNAGGDGFQDFPGLSGLGGGDESDAVR
jgi:hypothetical protein